MVRVIEILSQLIPGSPQIWIFDTVHLLVCGAALALGGKTEKAMAIVAMTSYFAVLTRKLWAPSATIFTMVVIEGATLTAIGWLSAKSASRWVLFAAAFDLLILLSLLAVSIKPDILGITYNDTLATLSYGVLAALAVGTYGAWRERRADRRRDAWWSRAGSNR